MQFKCNTKEQCNSRLICFRNESAAFSAPRYTRPKIFQKKSLREGLASSHLGEMRLSGLPMVIGLTPFDIFKRLKRFAPKKK